jgi:hypothetical protein
VRICSKLLPLRAENVRSAVQRTHRARSSAAIADINILKEKAPPVAPTGKFIPFKESDNMDVPDKDKPQMEYSAHVASPVVNGEVKITIGKHAFTATGLFDVAEIPYAKVESLEFANFTTTVKTEEGDFVFSRIGNMAQTFYDGLCDAYGKAMLRAFFIFSKPLGWAIGDYRYDDHAKGAYNKTPLKVFETGIVTQPPNIGARRIPMCFMTGMDKQGQDITIKLDRGETYTFSRLGLDTAPFVEATEKQIRGLRERTISIVKEIDPTLTMAQASQIARFTPEGVSAPMGQIASLAPSFAAAVEEKLSKTRGAEYYNMFKELCDPAKIWVGFKKNDLYQGESSSGKQDEKPDPYLFWMIAPSPNGKFAAVEFAVQPGESAATFVYRTGGDFEKTAAQLNRTLEAIAFKRDVIRLTDEELLKPEYADHYMASKRTESLKFIRANFAGRIIHYSPGSWKNDLTEMWK